jgi:hypothetical protein
MHQPGDPRPKHLTPSLAITVTYLWQPRCYYRALERHDKHANKPPIYLACWFPSSIYAGRRSARRGSGCESTRPAAPAQLRRPYGSFRWMAQIPATRSTSWSTRRWAASRRRSPSGTAGWRSPRSTASSTATPAASASTGARSASLCANNRYVAPRHMGHGARQ